MNLNDQSGVPLFPKIINVELDEELEEIIEQQKKSYETIIKASIDQNAEEELEETMVEEKMDEALYMENVQHNQSKAPEDMGI